MKILVFLHKSYYRDPHALNPNYYNFVTVPKSMGNNVVYCDHREISDENQSNADEILRAMVTGGEFDLTVVETGAEEFSISALKDAKEKTVLLGFNSDDDFRWLDYSTKYSDAYTYQITTYRHIYEHAKMSACNVIYCPWACSGMYSGLDKKKDICFSFAGGVHGDRLEQLRAVNRHVPIKVYGKGSAKLNNDMHTMNRVIWNAVFGKEKPRKCIKKYIMNKLNLHQDSMNYKEINSIWNKTKISYTPLSLNRKHYKQKIAMAEKYGYASESDSQWTTKYQVKGRVFDQGLSGSLMICERNTAIDEYYELGREYVVYEDYKDLKEKVEYYIRNEKERYRIAEKYYRRTEAEHLWVHRWRMLLEQIGLR